MNPRSMATHRMREMPLMTRSARNSSGNRNFRSSIPALEELTAIGNPSSGTYGQTSWNPTKCSVIVRNPFLSRTFLLRLGRPAPFALSPHPMRVPSIKTPISAGTSGSACQTRRDATSNRCRIVATGIFKMFLVTASGSTGRLRRGPSRGLRHAGSSPPPSDAR